MKLGTKILIALIAISVIPFVAINLAWISAENIQISEILNSSNGYPIPFIFLTSLLLLVTLIAINFWVAKRIIDPIAKLNEGLHVIQSGNLDYRVDIKSGDEIEDLSQDFNLMADHLKENFRKLQMQNTSADRSAQLLLGRDLDLRKMNDELEEEKEAISAEKNKLSVILSGVSDAIIALDLNRNIISFNKVAEHLTEFSESEVLGKPIDQVIKLRTKEWKISPLEYCPDVQEDFEGIAYTKKGVEIFSLKNNLNSLNSKGVFVNLIASQIREGKRVNLGCILTLHNVSEERQLEEMKLDFVSMAAHELRTPLTAIRGYLSVFINENKAKFNDEQNMFLSRINIATQQLMGLIENLLNVSKIERGIFNVNLEPTDWLALTKQIFSWFEERAKAKNITFQLIEPATPLPKVSADKLRITEVLGNLLSNAIAYTPAGGQIQVKLEQNNNYIVTHVQDNGEGIPKEAIPKLFTKFFRVSGNLEQGSKGTGLGLYIAKSIIDMHHGQIGAQSEPGKGSTFSFALPIAAA